MNIQDPWMSSRATGVRKVMVLVHGMHSARCVASVASALRLIAGVSDVEVSLNESRAVLSLDPQKVELAQLRTAVAVVGFEAVSCVDLSLADDQAAA